MPDIPMNRDVTYFARTNFRGGNEVFGIKRKDRRQHMYVLGKSGTGKSVLLSNMVIQNIWNGEGVCLVDPHGELVETVLKTIPEHRLKDVVYFNPADTEFCIGFNPLELRDPKYKHLVASGLMGIFTKIWANVWSSRMEYIMNNTILALLDTPGSTLLGITRMLVDKDYRQVIIDNLNDPMVKAFWVHEYEQWKDQFRNEAIAPIQNKVGQFLSSSIIRNIIGQQESTIDIFNLMNEGKIFLVNVSKGRIGEDNSALLGAMIITKLQLAAMERVRIPEDERRDFYLYVDEFQNFATDSFASILSEARKYRLCLTLAHQYTAQIEGGDSDLKDAVFGNVGSMIIFRIGAEDAKTLEKEFAPEFTPEDFIGLPNYHVYLKLMIDGITSRPFSANTLPPIAIKQDYDTTKQAIEYSRSRYCRPQSKVEANINSWSSTSGGTEINRAQANSTGHNNPVNNMHPAVCINCEKEIMVPFEPKPGKPIYCKECLHKIKVGELKPSKGFYDKTQNEGPKPAEALAAIGIEYEPDIITTKPGNSRNSRGVRPEYKKESKPFVHDIKTQSIDPQKNELLKQTGQDKEGFTTLKDLLTTITEEPKIAEKPKVPQIQPDPKKVTLHPRISKTETKEEKKIFTPAPKAATSDTKEAFKNIMISVASKPTTEHANVVSPNKTPATIQTPRITEQPAPTPKTETPTQQFSKQKEEQKPPETTIEFKKEDKTKEIPKEADELHDVPKPPASYSKRTPQKEVPEDVLREIFNEDNI